MAALPVNRCMPSSKPRYTYYLPLELIRPSQLDAHRTRAWLFSLETEQEESHV